MIKKYKFSSECAAQHGFGKHTNISSTRFYLPPTCFVLILTSLSSDLRLWHRMNLTEVRANNFIGVSLNVISIWGEMIRLIYSSADSVH